MSKEQENPYKLAYERERLAKEQAEHLLEAISYKIYKKNKSLERKSNKLTLALDSLQQTQMQLVQSEKMASIGQLSAGIAHEINNPIAYIYSNLNSLQRYIEALLTCNKNIMRFVMGEHTPDTDSQKHVTDICRQILSEFESVEFDYLQEDMHDLVHESIEGASRVKEIVANLQIFSRPHETGKHLFDIQDCIEPTIKIAKNQFTQDTKLELDLHVLPKVYGVASKINQVILNILVNAAHAIAHVDNAVIKIRAFLEETWICITIEDNGYGIEHDKLTEIFNPFFSTKDIGEGTGLGLSISYDIMQEHGGCIEVTSEANVGTTFTLKFPMPSMPDDIQIENT